MSEDKISLYLPKEKRETLLKLISAGNYQRTACRAAGVSEATFYEWKRKGEAARDDLDNGMALTQTEEELVWFVNELDEARAKAEAALVYTKIFLCFGTFHQVRNHDSFFVPSSK